METKFWVICLSILFASCSRDINNIYNGGEDKEENEKVNKDDFFEFTTTRNNQIIIDYGMKVKTVFSLYDENPIELVENTWEFKNIDPIYSGTTGDDGKFSSTAPVPLPSYLRKVWLVTDNVLVASPIELNLDANGLTFSYDEYKTAGQRSRAIMDGTSYPDGYDTLGEWNGEGVPTYLLSEKQELPSGFLKRCNALAKSISTDNIPLFNKFPELRTKGNNDMVITKTTGLVATYFESSAGWEDMVAYYTYQENEKVDLLTIKKTLLFPRYSKYAPKSLIGSQVKLKYWNKDKEEYEDDFPAGTHIGWILLGNAYNNSGKATLRYSNPIYNEDNGQQRSVLLSDRELDNCFFMAMEDNVDMRFNDVQFAIMASTSSSVEPTPSIPDEVNKGETYYVVKGSLAFEDNWPKQGDYDMNDVVIYFSSTVVKDIDKDNLVRTTTTFIPVNNGAAYTNGFGFQLDKVPANKASVTVTQEGNLIKDSFESGTEKPVVMLFSDIKTALNKPITVVIHHGKYANIKEEDCLPPYNPFIFVNERSHEVHLPDYKPTSKANEELRGTENDLKQDDNGKEMFYISKDNMPFAIYISGVEFKWPSESMTITEYYPQFQSWRDSFGKENEDWYKYPKK